MGPQVNDHPLNRVGMRANYYWPQQCFLSIPSAGEIASGAEKSYDGQAVLRCPETRMLVTARAASSPRMRGSSGGVLCPSRLPTRFSFPLPCFSSSAMLYGSCEGIPISVK